MLGYNEAGDEISFYPVTALISHVDPVIVQMVIAGEMIETTPEHPFYTVDGEWVETMELRVGDEIRQANWAIGEVESIFFTVHPQRMYNFSVSIAHTYFIGDGQWLVHNAGPCERVVNSNMWHASGRGAERAGYGSRKEAREALRIFGRDLEQNGLPSTAIQDPAHADRVIVPGFGEGGAVVYQRMSNGSLRLKTVLTWR